MYYSKKITKVIFTLISVLLLLSACQSNGPGTAGVSPGETSHSGGRTKQEVSLGSGEGRTQKGPDVTSAQTDGAVLDHAVAVFDKDRNFGSTEKKLFERSTKAMSEGRFKDAVMLLLALTGDKPNLSSPWTNLGIAYGHLGETEKSIQAFEQALVNNPTNCVALNHLGIRAREAGKFQAAEARYLTCIEHVPEFREAHLNLGILYEMYMGKYAAALREYLAYQSLLDAPDRRIAGWVADLERRQVSMVAASAQ
ncbi:MAG: tetratricopeptide repeat protein [Pseudomonadales bacterium]|nr:tetratricopeptide repeat protein [Pseudomonadales bacterium]